jgi:lipopolysaccharide biosynthesis glycosyltransferase
VARTLFEVFERHAREDSPVWASAEAHRDWMRPWIAADAGSPTAPSPAGRRTFAVVDYGHPGANRASANIGDHVQSIASLGHLVRHRGVRLHGREDLVGLLRQLGDRTRPELRRDDVDADLEVMTIHRDASMYEAIPEDTWVLCFGWYMHALFSMRHGFPLHRNLRPIFISFHCNKRELLTPDAVEYLRRYGPVGCRDWTTVYLLLSLGVPAFFSGCLTTTINTVFPDLTDGPPADAPVAYVDAQPEDVPADGVTYKHSSGAVRRRSFVENVYAAVDLLETYRGRHRRVVTSRLHCYLPVRSLGVDVDFRPKNPSDVRFDGLIDIDDKAFRAIRDGLADKLEQVFGAILTGRSEEDVYELWRGITAADVAAAEERRMAAVRLPPVAADIAGQVETARSATLTRARTAQAPVGEELHCAVLLRKRGERPLSVLLASLLEHASRPLHVCVLALPGADADDQRLADAFPQITLSWVPLAGLNRDLRTPAAKQPSTANVARLLLADLLPAVDRLTLLPLPAVATGDIAELAGLDLGGHALAAPTRPGTKGSSGFGLIHAAAGRLTRRTQAAATLRRTAHARHTYDFDAFTDDVLVLDLARMRAEDFSGQALPLVEQFGLNSLEVLHYLTGRDRAIVPEHWATVPTRTPIRGPGLIHWADRVKPWQSVLTPERERWRRLAATLEQPDG